MSAGRRRAVVVDDPLASRSVAVQRCTLVAEDAAVVAASVDCATTASACARLARQTRTAQRIGRLQVGVAAEGCPVVAEDVAVSTHRGAATRLTRQTGAAQRRSGLDVGVAAERGTLLAEDVAVTTHCGSAGQ